MITSTPAFQHSHQWSNLQHCNSILSSVELLRKWSVVSTALLYFCRVIQFSPYPAVYGPDGRLDKRFLSSTKTALTSVADIAEELSNRFKLTLDESEPGLSRVSATLHLQYHHIIVLSTRPLLFSLFKKRLEAQHSASSITSSLHRLRILLQMCADSTRHSLSILSILQSQDLLGVYL